jgi:large conductance mechanosensitive channel
MGMLKEFREFAVKGNVMDMAVGIIIGGAFTPIVKSLVDDVIMPPIGLLLGGVDFSEHRFTLKEKTDEAAAVTVNYGSFVNVVITFVIVAFAVFVLVKGMNRLRAAEAPPAPTTRPCPECQMPIPLAATRCGHCTTQVPARG